MEQLVFDLPTDGELLKREQVKELRQIRGILGKIEQHLEKLANPPMFIHADHPIGPFSTENVTIEVSEEHHPDGSVTKETHYTPPQPQWGSAPFDSSNIDGGPDDSGGWPLGGPDGVIGPTGCTDEPGPTRDDLPKPRRTASDNLLKHLMEIVCEEMDGIDFDLICLAIKEHWPLTTRIPVKSTLANFYNHNVIWSRSRNRWYRFMSENKVYGCVVALVDYLKAAEGEENDA